MDEEETDEAGVVLVSRSMRWAHRGSYTFIDDDGEGPYLATSDDLAIDAMDGEWAGPVEPPLQGQSR